MILAITSVNIVYSEAKYSTVTGLVYHEFLKKIYEVLGERDYTIVMDIAPIHPSNPEFYHTYEYQVIFLPSYCPFTNPCEDMFFQLKNSVRRNGNIRGNVDLTERMITACTEITTDNLQNYFRNSESFFQMCLNVEDIARE
ncbi:hypothetical protein RF11_09130 [Thelohanellus kitauei]|uniref:Tc1-like transposase DDE domain-containing protein n=1 Tax=Thelohanellus kitauei TaxID=669202 RepID=A0A0C2MBW5_THEKT|nr:hypothetical protein RF11_09130 [Thelohanellus kitauei]